MDPRIVPDRSDIQLVDVRAADEWADGHQPGAVHIPLDDLGDRSGELDSNRTVVTVCRTGRRSAQAADDLAGRGFSAESMAGGLDAWEGHGLPLVTD